MTKRKIFTRPTLSERLWSKVLVSESIFACWPWTASVNAMGYGQIHHSIVGGKQIVVLAHRQAYIEVHGEIPDDLPLDHLCRNHPCCNPWHVEPVTTGENTRRGEARFYNLNKTHCPGGHEYTPENTRILKSGSRACRACPMAKYYEKKASVTC